MALWAAVNGLGPWLALCSAPRAAVGDESMKAGLGAVVATGAAGCVDGAGQAESNMTCTEGGVGVARGQFRRGEFRKKKFSPPPGILKLVGSGWFLIFPDRLWMVALIFNAFQSHNHCILQPNTSLSLPSAWHTAAHI